MPQVTPFAELRSRGGTATVIGLSRNEDFERLARAGMADVAVVSTENGFSPLGQLYVSTGQRRGWSQHE